MTMSNGPWPLVPQGRPPQPAYGQGPAYAPPRLPNPARPLLSPGHRSLARALQGFLLACVVFLGLEALAQAWLVFLAWRSSTGDLQDATLVQDVDLFGNLAVSGWGLCLLVGCILWCIWQVQLAGSAMIVPGMMRRTPGMHAGSWFIPVVSLWFPLENVRDLDRGLPGESRVRGRIGGWWALWITGGIATNISDRVLEQATLGLLEGALLGNETSIMIGGVLGIVANALLMAAGLRARAIVGELTQRAHDAQPQSRPAPTGWPGGPVGPEGGPRPGHTWEPTLR